MIPESFQTIFKKLLICCYDNAYLFLPILLKATGAVKEEFPKAASTRLNDFAKAAGNFRMKYRGNCQPHTVNPALLATSFVRQIQLSLLHISLFKVIEIK
jgi:hypothetical protein